jgi:uroporphyrinogen-III synthase
VSKIYLTSPKEAKDTIYLPMIEFKRVADSIDFDGVDTLMFTSKQAVKVANSITKRWREFDSIAIGPATKKAILELGGRVIFQPKNFYGKELASDILKHFKDRKILYLRPKKIIFDSKGFLKRYGIELKEQIIYQTECKSYPKDAKPESGSIIVFTSPSTIECFLKNFGWESSLKAVVIGKSTLEHLPPDIEYKVAPTPSIQACIDTATAWSC